MTDSKITVLDGNGRFPHKSKTFRWEDIEVLVTQREPGVFFIRLDSTRRGCEDFWLQLRVAVEAKEGGPCSQ